MAQAVPDTLVGATLTWAAQGQTTGFTMEVTSLDINIESGIIDTTHMGSTQPTTDGTTFGGRTYMSSKLHPGTITLEGHFDGDENIPVRGVSGNLEIAWPLNAGDITPADITGDVHVESVNISGSVDPEDHLVITLVLQIAGVFTLTAAA